MAEPKPAPKTAPHPAAAPPPAWHIADEDLYQGGEHTLPVLAFAAGDQVPHEQVERHGWHDRVHTPDQWAPAPPTQPSSKE